MLIIVAISLINIIVDGLKGEVTARCGMLIKNAVTFGFVKDIISGTIKESGAKKEYKDRILNNKTPTWYRNKMEEN